MEQSEHKWVEVVIIPISISSLAIWLYYFKVIYSLLYKLTNKQPNIYIFILLLMRIKQSLIMKRSEIPSCITILASKRKKFKLL